MTRNLFLFSFLLMGGVFCLGSIVQAAFTCSLSPVCNAPNITVLRLSGSENAHAELSSQATYPQQLCCGGIVGLGTECGGTFAVLAKLSSVSNAHVEQPSLSNYGQSACISAPNGNEVDVKYGTDCAIFGTEYLSILSFSHATNAHAGAANIYPLKVCAKVVPAGSLTVDVVDQNNVSVDAPMVAFTHTLVDFDCSLSSGTFGLTSQKIRVANSTPQTSWTLTLAPTNGATSTWNANAFSFDYNDHNGIPAGCADGNDADVAAGQLTIDPSVATITPSNGCSSQGISAGGLAAYLEGGTNSVSLMEASDQATTGCAWDMTGIRVSQRIPAETRVGNYVLPMTLTITAN